MADNRLSGLVVLCSLPAEGQRGSRPERRDRPTAHPVLPTARRVDDLLVRMTVEGNVAQRLCLWKGKHHIADARGASTPPGAAVVPGRDRAGRAPRATASFARSTAANGP